MKVVVISNFVGSLLNVRASLLLSMIKAGHVVLACAPEDNHEVRTRMRTLGVSYHPVPLQRTGINPLMEVRSFFALVRLFRQFKPDCLFSYTIKPVIYGSLAAWLAGVRRERVFSMITGLGYAFTAKSAKQSLLSSPVRMLYRSALRHNGGVFFHNPDDRDLFLELGLLEAPTRALLVNGSGVDLIEYPEHPPVVDPVTFLLIARLLKGKGIEEYVEAATALKARHPAARFRLIGPHDSNPAAIAPEEVRRWEDAGVIEYGGGVKDVRPELAQSSVFVLPSHREGTPRAVLEAMAMGRPIITTDAPGCRETVQPGQNGLLVPVQDAVALERAMERFIDNRGLISSMGRRSREMAVDKYDVAKVNESLMREMGLN